MVVGDVTTAVDVLVLGAGPGGYVAAIRAAQLGRHVTLIDHGLPGGTCLHQGCIPLKALLSASERYQQTRSEELTSMGIYVEAVSFDWASMQAWKQGVVDRLAAGVRRLIAGNRVEYVHGTGWFINAQEVRVEGEHGSLRFKFEHCIIATGADAAPLSGLSFDGKQILTPEQALMMTEIPEALSIVGDDYIALELATLFARLGVKVKLLSPGVQLLSGVDSSALRLVQAGLRKLGIQVSTGVALDSIAERPVVISQGVCPRTFDLHLDAVGLEVIANGGIKVNSMQQSSVSHIFAIGDCTGGRALASIAMKQAKVAAEVLSGQRVHNIVTGRFPLAANGRALTLGNDNGVALLVANADDGTLLGATLVGPHAGDLIEQSALAIEMGATLTDLSEILYAHPGLSETLLEAAEGALGRAVHMLARG